MFYFHCSNPLHITGLSLSYENNENSEGKMGVYRQPGYITHVALSANECKHIEKYVLSKLP